MRVLLVNESARCHTGGANRVVMETLELLAGAGHDVALAYWDGQPGEAACPTYRFSLSVSDSIFEARWQEILRGHSPDIVQVHQIDHPFFLGKAGPDIPYVRFLHDQSWFCSAGDRMVRGYEPCHRPHDAVCFWHHYASRCGGKNPVGNWQRWQRVQRNLSSGRGQYFQVASEFMAHGLEENGIPRDFIDVVPLYARDPGQSAQVEPGRIMIASRLVPAKGVHLAVDAMAHLKDVSCSLVIAGEGPERRRLEARTAKLNLEGRVRFLGEIPPAQVDAELARAELVMTPTLRPEPFGLIGPEAMAHGRPVIAFDGGATPEWLQNGINGAMVSQRSAEALATAVRSLFSNRARMQAMGKNGQEMWRQRFSPDAYIQRLLLSFERVIARQRKISE